MTTLVVGASGATGSLVVEQLIGRGQNVKVIVRSPERIPEPWKHNTLISIIYASVLDINEADMAEHVKDCHAIVSCLGHNLSLKGLYGKPRKLVTDAVRLLCNAVERNTSNNIPVKFLLMNTTGNQNRDLDEPVPTSQKLATSLLRVLLPPHADNETAADFLRINIGQKHEAIEWAAIRPDSLIGEKEVSEYETHISPTRNPIFNAGKTSRINVAHFMTELILKDDLWNQWKGQMPVIYNK